MDKQKLVTKGDTLGHKIDDSVGVYAEKHKYPKWKVWIGLAVIIGIIAYFIC